VDLVTNRDRDEDQTSGDLMIAVEGRATPIAVAPVAAKDGLETPSYSHWTQMVTVSFLLLRLAAQSTP